MCRIKGNGNMASGNGETRTVRERKLERLGREVRKRERWRRDFVMTSDGERTREKGNGNMASGNVRTCAVRERS